jgi:hypothetical protein
MLLPNFRQSFPRWRSLLALQRSFLFNPKLLLLG